MTDWNTTTEPVENNEPETEETGLSPEDKAERKRERQNTKYTCLELAVRAANGNADSDNIITGAAKFYAFVTGTKVRTKKEG